MPRDEKSIRIGKTVIPAHAIHWQFSRSQGPGGQHVNKTNSRAELRIDIQQTDFLSPAVARRLRTEAGNRGEHRVKAGHRHENHRVQYQIMLVFIRLGSGQFTITDNQMDRDCHRDDQLERNEI